MAGSDSRRTEKEQLIAKIEASRGAIREDLRSIAHASSAPSRLARILRSAPAKAATASAAFGLVSSLLVRRPGPARHKNRLAPLLRRVLDLARTKFDNQAPITSLWQDPKVKKLVQDWLNAPK